MSAYRKKPVVIEAVQYDYNEWAENPLTFRGDTVPEWLSEAISNKTIVPEFRDEDYWYVVIKTLEGDMTAGPDDWIIRGVQGELYPCKPDIVEATYEPAEARVD